VRRGVFLKLFAAFLLVIAAATVTLDFTVRRAWKASLEQEIERAMVEKTRLFAHRVENERDLALQQLVTEEAAAGNARATVIDPKGKVLADSQADAETMENHAGRPEFAAALRGQIGMSQRLSHTVGIPFLYVAAPVQRGAVRMAYPLSSVQQTTAKVRRSLLIGSATALAVAMLLAGSIAQLVARRLRRIVVFAERIAAGELSARIAESPSDEIATVAAALDRTARNLEESFAAVETSRQQLETLLNSMQEAVIAVGPDGKALWVNGRMQRLVGSGVRIGAPVVQTVRDPSFLAAVESAMARKDVCVTRATALLPGRVFQVTAAPMPPSGAVAVLHDLTDVERVEKTRRDFIANVSHELRTPLTSVQGYAETLLDSPAADSAASREFLEIIVKNAARMSRLTEDLLVLARVESGEHRFDVRPVSASDLLKDACVTLAVAAREAGMELRISESASETVLADSEGVHQVLANLIRNALAYAPEGGRIEIGARARDQRVEFFVRDFGSGIASEHLPRLFERFYRVDKARSRDSGGTGLGLAIVKHIVLAHGGDVRAESQLGRGSTFYFTMPLAQAEPAEPAKATPGTLTDI
jgi:two-component system, OmpR family, phosphate regulon sensor histidine kinase PhoR